MILSTYAESHPRSWSSRRAAKWRTASGWPNGCRRRGRTCWRRGSPHAGQRQDRRHPRRPGPACRSHHRDVTGPACASACGQVAVSGLWRWISTTRPVDSQKNLVITLRTPCATRRGSSRKSLTTDGGPVSGETRGTQGRAGRPAIPGGARYPVAVGRRIGRRVIGSLARPGWARPLHLIHGGASALSCPVSWRRAAPVLAYFEEQRAYRAEIWLISGEPSD